MIGNFQASKYFNIREKEYRCLWPVIKIYCKPITTVCGVSSVLKSEWNNICVANVSDQSARKYKENVSTEVEKQSSIMHKKEGIFNIWFVFVISKIVVNFILVTCSLFVGLMEILNSHLRYNFSWASYTRQQRKTLLCNIP